MSANGFILLSLLIVISGDDWRFLFEGFTKSPCTIPCSTFHTRTKYISKVREVNEDKFRVKLFFIPEMKVNSTAAPNSNPKNNTKPTPTQTCDVHSDFFAINYQVHVIVPSTRVILR